MSFVQVFVIPSVQMYVRKCVCVCVSNILWKNSMKSIFTVNPAISGNMGH